MEKIKVGAKFFLNPEIFPYCIIEEDAEYITYKRNGYTAKRVYRYVFENAIKCGAIEFINN